MIRTLGFKNISKVKINLNLIGINYQIIKYDHTHSHSHSRTIFPPEIKYKENEDNYANKILSNDKFDKKNQKYCSRRNK